MISFVSAFYEFNRRLGLLVTMRNETRAVFGNACVSRWSELVVKLHASVEGNCLSRSKDTDGCVWKNAVIGSIDWSRWRSVSLTVKSQYSIARRLGEQVRRRSRFGPDHGTSRTPKSKAPGSWLARGKDFPEIIGACRSSRVLEQRWKCSEKAPSLSDFYKASHKFLSRILSPPIL